MIGRVRFEKWSFLFYINIVINEIIIEKLNKWFYLRENEKHLNRKNWFVTCIKCWIDTSFKKTQKTYAVQFYQLKVGNSVVGLFLEQIKVNKLKKCWCCRAVE